MRTLILVIVLTPGVLAQTGSASSIDAARELYASADYRAALEMLDRLAATDPARPDRPSIDLYRAFCLIALERAGEADEAIVAMITRDPLYRPADAEVPPRLRPVFSDKRRVVLPGVIQTRYERAKTATAASRVDATPKPVRIFDSNDLDVVPPVTVKQDIPRVQRPLLVERTGVLFIVIDERGGVESAIITEPLDRTYDSMVLAAARAWTYQAAMRNGTPVKYRKRFS